MVEAFNIFNHPTVLVLIHFSVRMLLPLPLMGPRHHLSPRDKSSSRSISSFRKKLLDRMVFLRYQEYGSFSVVSWTAQNVRSKWESGGKCMPILVTSRAELFRFVAFFAILATTSLTASAQTASPTPIPVNTPAAPQPSPTPRPERQFFKNILNDQRAIWTSPLHLQGDDAKWLVPLGLTTGGLIATDRQTADAIADKETLQKVSHVISVFGSGNTTGGIAAAFISWGVRKTTHAHAKPGCSAGRH